MNMRTVLIVGMLVLLGLGMGNLPNAGSLAKAQDVNQNRIRLYEVAKKAYEKLKIAREDNPQAISDDALSGASLEWFKAEVALAKSKSAAMKAAIEYVDRENDIAKK